MIYLGLSAIVIVYGWLYIAVQNNKRLISEEQHRIKLYEERNKQVFYFRERMIHEFEHYVNSAMPSYDEMLKSDKPLIASNWVDVDKLVNLN